MDQLAAHGIQDRSEPSPLAGEGEALQHLQVGKPSIPAHLAIGAAKGWPGYADALAAMV